jgi:hypothetical protein
MGGSLTLHLPSDGIFVTLLIGGSQTAAQGLTELNSVRAVMADGESPIVDIALGLIGRGAPSHEAASICPPLDRVHSMRRMPRDEWTISKNSFGYLKIRKSIT